MKNNLKNAIIIFVISNLFVFLILAFAGKLPADPKQLVFIDFWGRVIVYSFWFMLYELYRIYFANPEPQTAG